MAVLTATLLAAGGLALAAGGAATSIIQGANAKSEAEDAAGKAAQSLAQMQESDKFKNLQVPTLGLEMAQQNVQARQAQQLQSLKDIGAAGVLGGLTAVNQQGQAEDLALAAQAQEAQYARDFAQAQNAQGVEQRNLARQSGLEQQRLAGAQSAAAYGQQQINSGISGLAQIGGNVLLQSVANQPLYGEQGKGELGTKGNPIWAGPKATPEMQAAQGQYENYLKNNPLMPTGTGVLAPTPPMAPGRGVLSPLNWNQQPAPYSWSSLGF
jgi:hypothetical protein